MNASTTMYVYAAVALMVSGYVLLKGVLAQPVPIIFGFGERMALVAAAFAVGALWPLFTPVAAVLEMRRFSVPGHPVEALNIH